MWGAWRLLVRSTGVLACLQAGRREVCSRGAVSPVTTSASTPSPSQANAPAPLTPWHSVAPVLGWPWSGENSNSDAEATWSRGGAGWGGGGRCWPLVKQLLRNPDLWQWLLYHSLSPQTGRKSMRAPPVVAWGFTIGLERQGPWVLWGIKGTWTQAVSEQSEGHNCRCLHRQLTRDSLDRDSVADTSQELTQAPLASALWGGDPSVGRGENTHLKGNKASLGLTFRASAPVTWDQLLPLMRQWQQLSRWNVLPHIQLQLKHLHLQANPPTKVMAARGPSTKRHVAFVPDSAPPPKHWACAVCIRMFPHENTPSWL